MGIIGGSLIFHISVRDLDHSSCRRERIPKETSWYVPLMVTVFQVIKKREILKLHQRMGNYSKSILKSKETEEAV